MAKRVITDKQRACQKRCSKNWSARNKTYLKEVTRRNHMNARMEVLQAFGGICECCGEHEYAFLCIDHRNGGGNKERKTLKESARQFWRRLKSEGYPKTKYRVLCHNCNFSIGAHGFCPHESLKLAP